MSTSTRALRASFYLLIVAILLVTGGGFRAAVMRADATAEGAEAALQTFSVETMVAAASYNGVPDPAVTQSAARVEKFYNLFVPWLDLDSTLFVQNTAASPATIMLELYDSVGGGIYTEITTINPLGSWVLDMATLASLPPGFQGGAVLLSDQPLAAVVNGQRSIGSLYSYQCGWEGALQVVLPEAMKDYSGYNADIWIQNAGDAPVDVEMTFYSGGGAVYTHVDSGIDVGRSRLYRTTDMAGLPSPFLGWVLVTASEPVVVASLLQDSVSLRTMAFRGTAQSAVGPALVSPRQQKDVSFTTILNLAPNVAALLASWYTASGEFVWSEAASAVPLENHVLTTAGLLSGFDGSLFLQSDHPVIGLSDWSGATLGAAAGASSPAIGLGDLTTTSYQPRVVHSEMLGKNTELSVLNAGPVPADVTVTFYTASGTVTAVLHDTIEANGVRRYGTGDVAALGDEWAGSAVVTSTQPIAVEVMQFLHKLVVDSTADSGNGTLREALSVAETGDTIIFDPEIFPVGNPATIALTSGPLPTLTQYDLTIDASSAGVILDGAALDNGHGLHITSNGNMVQGMQILHFPDDGIRLDSGASLNLIGGSVESERNVLSGNVGAGVGIYGTSTLSNTISGNFIGTDASGTIALANSGHGISLGNGSRYNVIGGQNATPGGACTGECNLVSGNTNQGVCLDYSDVMSTIISGNYIGTDVTGSSALPNRGGVWIGHGAQHNTVGGDRTLGEGNLLSGNLLDGVNLQRDGTMYNQIIGNDIGITADGTGILSNGARGIDITLGAQYNIVGGTGSGEANVIRSNGLDGVYVDGVSTLYNTVTRNTIYGNSNLGIDLANGGNAELPSPAIASYDPAAGTAAGIACPNCTVELFSDEEDEGRWFEASTVADGNGVWSIAKGSAFHGPVLTATATDATGNTSEFGQFASTWLSVHVDLQGRADDSAALFTAWTSGQDAGSCISGQDGTCSIPLASGSYSVTVEMASYLDSTWDSASISEGESATLPTVLLPGGDTNDDCVVNIQDLAFMGYRFNACEGDPLYDVRGDINGDGCINILDLAMTGGNFDRTCPVPW